MYICKKCHRTCSVRHSTIGFGPCEVCGKETHLSDCVSSKPITKEELKDAGRARSAMRCMYLFLQAAQYPRVPR